MKEHKRTEENRGEREEPIRYSPSHVWPIRFAPVVRRADCKYYENKTAVDQTQNSESQLDRDRRMENVKSMHFFGIFC